MFLDKFSLYLNYNTKMIFVLLLLLSSTPGINVLAKNGRGSNAVTHHIQWDPQSTAEMAFGMVHSLNVNLNEYMDIFCPQYDPDEPSPLKFVIYNVSKDSFNNCLLASDATKIFACNTPSTTRKLTIKFQRNSPNPLGFIYRPGHTYYYMSFVEDLPKTCENAMRMDVKVSHKHRTPKHSTIKTPGGRSSTLVNGESFHISAKLSSLASASNTTIPFTPKRTSSTTTIIPKKNSGLHPVTAAGQTLNKKTTNASSSPKYTFLWLFVTLLITILLQK